MADSGTPPSTLSCRAQLPGLEFAYPLLGRGVPYFPQKDYRGRSADHALHKLSASRVLRKNILQLNFILLERGQSLVQNRNGKIDVFCRQCERRDKPDNRFE